MIIRALDASGDWTFGQGRENYLSGNPAIALNIATRLRCFLRNCFFDQQMGIDWKRYMGIPTPPQEIILSVRGIILQSYGVVKLNKISVSQSQPRNIIINESVDTIFGTPLTQNLEVLPYA